MNTLAELLSSGVKAEILRLLFGPAGRELHVRELARQSGFADATVRQELRRLTRLGLVTGRRDGNRLCYRADPAHPLFPELRGLVMKTTGLVDVLREALRDPGVAVAFVFGSMANRQEQAQSDVDVMVIGRVGLRKLATMLSGVADRLGREVNPHAMTIDEFARRRAGRDHFLTGVLAAPKLFVVGSEHELETMGR